MNLLEICQVTFLFRSHWHILNSTRGKTKKVAHLSSICIYHLAVCAEKEAENQTLSRKSSERVTAGLRPSFSFEAHDPQMPLTLTGWCIFGSRFVKVPM